MFIFGWTSPPTVMPGGGNWVGPCSAGIPFGFGSTSLFPSLPPDADLPPLFVSPAAASELNTEVYDFLALALRAFVNTWWTKITRYDKEFLPEITRILTAVFRTLEARLLATDLSPLVFRDLSTLLNQHWSDYRNAQSKLHTSYATGGAATVRQLFHQMQPHMAVSTDGKVDEVYIRQVVDELLRVTLLQVSMNMDKSTDFCLSA